MEGKDNVLSIYDLKNNRIKEKNITKEIFIGLVKENKISLYRLAKSMLKMEADVEDVISETILKAFKNINKLKELESFKPWIMRILVNECYALINKKNKIDLEENMEVYNLKYEEVESKSLIWAINQLNDDSRAVIILFYYEDMSIKDMSSILNVPEGTVKSRLSRAKDKLKIILEKERGSEVIG
ncbi:sigma-70 family RNA polymerase sigma factor [Clostridium ihumii]|uniref:sigma-70 family RNA polymerase sigma factor n=1 Tax=Clostridium ihumii TaxID=1470356 RepID=UPI003D34F460